MIRQYLTFTLNDSLYAVNVFQIQEVLEYKEPQKIPCSSDLLLGIIKSRSTNISVIDIRKKFGLESLTPQEQSRIIVLEITDYDDGIVRLYGIVVDSVLEVIDFDEEKLEPLAKKEAGGAGKFVEGVSPNKDGYTLFLDVNKIFSVQELDSFNKKD